LLNRYQIAVLQMTTDIFRIRSHCPILMSSFMTHYRISTKVARQVPQVELELSILLEYTSLLRVLVFRFLCRVLLTIVFFCPFSFDHGIVGHSSI